MVKKTKQYDAKLKAKIAIDALKADKTVLELCTQHNIPKANLHDWKNKLIASAEEIFIPEYEKNRVAKQLKQEIEGLHKLIGEITIENNYLKKKLLK
jgi:transposase